MTIPATRITASEDQAEVLAFLASGQGFAVQGPCRRIDTHAASIFLAGDRAWKLKRAVRYPYLDFSTPEKRRAVLDAELRLNRRTAPDLYLAVHPIVRSGGRLAIGGPGRALDWILEMRRFPDGALLDDLACQNLLDYHLLERLAARIDAFHAAAQSVRVNDGAARFQAVIDGNGESLRPYLAGLGAARIDALLDRQRTQLARHATLLDARGRAGKVRHVHGDLHLANIALLHGEPTPFDCLEFDDALATTDIAYDLAFLVMDLWHRDLHTQANLLFNRSLDLSGDEDAVRLMPLFLSVRATIRAHVLAAAAARTGDSALLAQTVAFLSLAERMIAPAPPLLVAIGGLSGTGKSLVSRTLAPTLGAVPGARILRSDVLRKRFALVPPEQKLPPSLYTPLATQTVYAQLGRLAGRHLSHGSAVIADAVAAEPDQRTTIARAAAHAHVRFAGLWLEAPEEVRLGRVYARGLNASDADAAIVIAQSEAARPAPRDWHHVDAEASPEQVVNAARQILEPAFRPGCRARA